MSPTLFRSLFLPGLVASALAGCPTRGSLAPLGEDAGPEPREDATVTPQDNGPPPDLGFSPDGAVILPDIPDTGPTPDTGNVTDTGNPVDAGPARPACRPITAAARAEPCAGNPSCGLPSRATVQITGNTAALEEYQVQVTLPSTVLSAVGSSCDRMVFRTSDNAWAPHFVTDCAMGKVWVRVPRMMANATTTLTLHYGGSTAMAAPQSYDDTFDRVPTRASNVIGAYTFDEATGDRTCPTVGTTPFDAFVFNEHYSPSLRPKEFASGATVPALWSTEAPNHPLAPNNANARFRRSQSSLSFGTARRATVEGMLTDWAPINWRSLTPEPFSMARTQLTVGIWARPTTPASSNVNTEFSTVVCFGMPDLAARSAFWRLPATDPRMIDNSIFNPWAIFFRGDGPDNTLFQGNTCVEPCTDVINYAHITTTNVLTRAAYVDRWHFMAFTFDSTTRPTTTRRSYYDERVFSYPADLELFPQTRFYCPNPLSFARCNPDTERGERIDCPGTMMNIPGAGPNGCAPLCPDGHGPCINPPEAPIMYPPAPVVIGADFNDGNAELGFAGQIDDFFIMNRAVSPDEMRAYRERRQYSADESRLRVTVQ
ncbi:MAG: hypothetical protein JNK72_20770 [Myxococcales bacterium]|nr:hypothetical protein [Myxococcales bacterium]